MDHLLHNQTIPMGSLYLLKTSFFLLLFYVFREFESCKIFPEFLILFCSRIVLKEGVNYYIKIPSTTFAIYENKILLSKTHQKSCV